MDTNTTPVIARSSRPETRNPLLLLPVARRFAELPTDAGAALALLLGEFSADCRRRAEKAYRTKKAPLFGYWAQLAVIARHVRLLLSKEARAQAKRMQQREQALLNCVRSLLESASPLGLDDAAAMRVDARRLDDLAELLDLHQPPPATPCRQIVAAAVLLQ